MNLATELDEGEKSKIRYVSSDKIESMLNDLLNKEGKRKCTSDETKFLDSIVGEVAMGMALREKNTIRLQWLWKVMFGKVDGRRPSHHV